jgi:hypothetical protein
MQQACAEHFRRQDRQAGQGSRPVTFSASVKFIGVLWKLNATPLLLTNL